MENQRMFQNPFSFTGRIRRLEYGISYIIYLAYYFTITFVIESVSQSAGSALISLIILIPALWFLFAQGAKRCHDRESSGWYQLIPFYGLWMLFGPSDYGENYYGPNPKGEGNESIEQMIDEIGTPDQE